MSIAVQTETKSEWRWLHTPGFDLFFILGFLTIATSVVAVVTRQPALFGPILLVDLWLLGYHHVIATYTRLMFDRESFNRSRWMIFGLFPVVAVATTALAWFVGLWAVFSLYFYWQWFHYTRQSWGVARSYRAKDPAALYEDGWLDQALFYSLPVLGIVFRSWQGPTKFLGQDLFVFTIPDWLMIAVAAAALGLVAAWISRRFMAWRQGHLARAHTAYLATHFLVFALAYVLIADITFGWLLINIWHNGQYILFVWMFNNRRFKNGVDSNARLLSAISQPRNLWLYMTVCLALTAVFYVGVLGTIENMLAMGLAGTILIYQTVNFHHYIVDSFLWKTRKGPMKEALGL